MTQAYDSRGFRLASSDAAALSACNAGVEGYNDWRADAVGHLDAAMQADPGFALPKIAKAWILHMGRSTTFADKIEQLTAQAQACLDPTIERDCALLAALRVASTGCGIEAATILEAHLLRHPTDLLAHRLVQFELFWNGRAAWMLDIIERAAPHWSADVEGYGAYLSCRAFANEESGNYADAERHGRHAVSINPTDVWGAHAVAHVLVMQARIAEGADWLQGLSGNWEEANQLRHHLWWHLCLFLLERGEHDRILELLTSQIRNPDSSLIKAVPDATIDLQNFASLLLRLELRGVDVSAHWDTMADICAGRIHNHANAFAW